MAAAAARQRHDRGTLRPDVHARAVGGDRFPPKVESVRNPTGVESLQLAWAVCPMGRHQNLRCGQPAGSTVTFPPANGRTQVKTHIPGNFAGVNTCATFRNSLSAHRRALRREVAGGQTFPLDKARDALQVAADRTAIAPSRHDHIDTQGLEAWGLG